MSFRTSEPPGGPRPRTEGDTAASVTGSSAASATGSVLPADRCTTPPTIPGRICTSQHTEAAWCFCLDVSKWDPPQWILLGMPSARKSPSFESWLCFRLQLLPVRALGSSTGTLPTTWETQSSGLLVCPAPGCGKHQESKVSLKHVPAFLIPSQIERSTEPPRLRHGFVPALSCKPRSFPVTVPRTSWQRTWQQASTGTPLAPSDWHSWKDVCTKEPSHGSTSP